MMLNALPSFYDQLRDNMLYGRKATIALEEVIYALKSKEVYKISETMNNPMAEGLLLNSINGIRKFKKNPPDRQLDINR